MAYNNTSNPIPQSATYCLAKALHHAKATQFYFELCVVEAKATHGAKVFLLDKAKKAGRIAQDVIGGVKTEEMKNILKADLADPLAMDAYTDLYISLTPENRAIAEDFLSNLLDKQISTQKQA